MKLSTVDKTLVTSCREISIVTEDLETQARITGRSQVCETLQVERVCLHSHKQKRKICDCAYNSARDR